MANNMLEITVNPKVAMMRSLEDRRRVNCIFIANLLMRSHVSIYNYKLWLKGEIAPSESALKRIERALDDLEQAMGI